MAQARHGVKETLVKKFKSPDSLFEDFSTDALEWFSFKETPDGWIFIGRLWKTFSFFAHRRHTNVLIYEGFYSPSAKGMCMRMGKHMATFSSRAEPSTIDHVAGMLMQHFENAIGPLAHAKIQALRHLALTRSAFGDIEEGSLVFSDKGLKFYASMGGQTVGSGRKIVGPQGVDMAAWLGPETLQRYMPHSALWMHPAKIITGRPGAQNRHEKMSLLANAHQQFQALGLSTDGWLDKALLVPT